MEGKNLITAAGQDIGKASALAYANEGANVIATDINSEILILDEPLAGCDQRMPSNPWQRNWEPWMCSSIVQVLSIMELCWNAERTTGIFPWISMRVRCSA